MLFRSASLSPSLACQAYQECFALFRHFCSASHHFISTYFRQFELNAGNMHIITECKHPPYQALKSHLGSCPEHQKGAFPWSELALREPGHQIHQENFLIWTRFTQIISSSLPEFPLYILYHITFVALLSF